MNKIKKIICNINKSDKKISEFGSVISIVLLLILWFYGDAYSIGFKVLFLFVFILLIGTIIPKIIKIPYLIWMSFSLLLGFVMFRAIFSFLYYVLITPIGLIMRMLKGNLLDKKYNNKDSYWLDYENDNFQKNKYEQIF